MYFFYYVQFQPTPQEAEKILELEAVISKYIEYDSDDIKDSIDEEGYTFLDSTLGRYFEIGGHRPQPQQSWSQVSSLKNIHEKNNEIKYGECCIYL